jgi:uncharacterized protein YndB with AHSA1/START domain
VSEQKPFLVDIVIHAPRDVVWRALTEPAEIRRWFGWDYPEIEAEIQYIFVDHADQQPPDRIVMEGVQTITVTDDGERTVVAVECPGTPRETSWDGVFDGMEEGWRTFFYQLRYYLERHRDEHRRTLYLTGTASPGVVLAALDAPAEEPYFASRHQIALEAADGRALLGVLSTPPFESHDPGKVTLTVTTYGLDDDAFAALRAEWAARWDGVVVGGNVVPAA